MNAPVVIQLPPSIKLPRVKYIMTVEGNRCIASNHYGDCALDAFNLWPWVQRHIAAEFDCDADEVRSVETEDGREFIAIGDRVVGYLAE